ncbi:hypothetical protein BN1195_03333 [Chryseobacterium oranimense G311]|nr:hypothetical protein BN1195_03333 [Chryseobacterium oranimense G311]
MYLIPGIFALASVLIVNPPMIYDDLYRFYDFYNGVKEMPIHKFWNVLKNLPDYILPIYIYIVSRLGIPVNFLLGTVTYFTVFIILRISDKILNKTGKNTIWAQIFIITAISLSGLLSGVRNLHSIALLYSAIYLLVHQKYLKSVFIFLVSVLVHFSTIFYLPVLGLLKLRLRVIHILWWISFIGFLLPIIYLPFQSENFTNYSSIPIIGKLQHYTFQKDYYFKLSLNNIKIILVSFYKLSWYLFTLIFLYYQLKNKKENVWLKILFIFSAVMNFTFIYLTFFERVSFFVKILFVICLLQENIINFKIKKGIFIYFLVLFFFQILLYIEGLYDLI